MSIKIEPGKSYRDREGNRWDYFSAGDHADYPHRLRDANGTTRSFTRDGFYLYGIETTPHDLIAEWTEPEAQPTDQPEEAAIPMLLWCPECGERHIDEGEFATKPHHTHACQSCGHVWRPAIVHTVGVRFLPGFKNEEAI